MDIRQQTGAVINRKKTELAASVADELLFSFETLLQQYELKRDDLIRYAFEDLSRLFLAIIADNKDIFIRYVEWQRSMMVSRTIPVMVLETNLKMLVQIIKRHLTTEEFECAEPFLSSGLNILKQEIPTEKSFLDAAGPNRDKAEQYLHITLSKNQKEAFNFIFSELDNQTMSIEELYLNILEPVQREIGRLWQINKITVSDEHIATDITRNIMGALLIRIQTRSPLTGNEKTIVTSCVGGELHDMGIRVVNDFFLMNGWKTVYTGANTPKGSILRTVIDSKADLLALSATMSVHLKMVMDIIKTVKDELQHTAPKIIVGGFAFNQHNRLWKWAGADGCASNAKKALILANSLIRKNDE